MEDPDEFTAFMDGIDFQNERGRPALGNVLYATPKQVLDHRRCSEECGVVRVRVRLVEWVREQNLTTMLTAEEVAADHAERRRELELECVGIVDDIRSSGTEAGMRRLANWLTERERRKTQGEA